MARAASALAHPNIVTVCTIEESDEGAFIVMEYLEGESLEARLTRGGALPADEVERLGVEAVLEGAVRKAGDRLRVTVQLVDEAGGHPRWSRRFDGAGRVRDPGRDHLRGGDRA